MKTLATIASALIAASALVFSSSAMAETKAPAGHHAHGHAHAESAFPMKAEAFKKLVDLKLERMKTHMDRGLEKRSLSHAQKSELDKSMEGAIKDLHAAVEKVGADGVVTKDEAKQIKDLSEQLRSKVRGELKGKHASAKAKGQKPAKGKKAKGAKKPELNKTNKI
jgi:archaellum component FlaC